MKQLVRFFDTMAGRIFAFLFIGLVLAGVAGVRFSAMQRASALEDLQHARAADRVAAFLSPEEALVGEGGASLSGARVPGVHELSGEVSHGARNEGLSGYLRGRIPDAQKVEAYDAPLQTCFPDTPGRAENDNRNPYWQLRPPSCWTAYLEFSDAKPLWLSIETPMTIVNTPSAFDPIYMSALFIGAALLAFMVARLAASPLRRLARSARQLGDDFEGTGFEENGPAEVRAAAMALNRMQKKIGQHVIERTRLLAAIAHDLQTPLTRMRLRLDHLERGEVYEKLLADTDEMRLLVREGLDLAHEVMPEEKLVQLDLDALVESIVHDAADMGVEVVFTEKSGCDVWARPLSLKRCITNLLNNAIRYGRDIEVRAASGDGDKAHVCVLDRGPGIPEDQLETIIQPFHKLERPHDLSRGGAGLGLAIANRFALLNGGALRLTNRPGGGLCAELTLPTKPPLTQEN